MSNILSNTEIIVPFNVPSNTETIITPIRNSYKNVLNFTITAPSLSKPLTYQFQSAGYIIVDINNPSVSSNSQIPAQSLIMPGNIIIKNVYPDESQFTQIVGNGDINQVIILYDSNNNILPNFTTNYPYVKKIKSFVNTQISNFNSNTNFNFNPSSSYNPSSSSNPNPSVSANHSPSPNTSPNTSSNTSTIQISDNTYIICGIFICIFFMVGGGVSISFNPGTMGSSRGGRYKYFEYGE